MINALTVVDNFYLFMIQTVTSTNNTRFYLLLRPWMNKFDIMFPNDLNRFISICIDLYQLELNKDFQK